MKHEIEVKNGIKRYTKSMAISVITDFNNAFTF